MRNSMSFPRTTAGIPVLAVLKGSGPETLLQTPEMLRTGVSDQIFPELQKYERFVTAAVCPI